VLTGGSSFSSQKKTPRQLTAAAIRGHPADTPMGGPVIGLADRAFSLAGELAQVKARRDAAFPVAAHNPAVSVRVRTAHAVQPVANPTDHQVITPKPARDSAT
jgi:hypothetical protein